MDTKQVLDTLSDCYSKKPADLVMDELPWRYLVRSALRGKNIVLVGPSGQGKTLSAKCLADVLNRPLTIINMGSTQDPRSTLIGNTHFSKTDGTFFKPSPFVKAISTPNSIVLLDELSRAHPDAANILLPVIDYGQRVLRLDENDGTVIKVADGVSFIATANVGNEYTNTRVMDRALLDRFTAKIVVDFLTSEQEMDLIKLKCPEADLLIMQAVIEIAERTRQYLKDGKLSKAISTRTVVEIAELTEDGFDLNEIAEVVIYSDYSAEGGIDSEQTIVKQMVQNYSSSGASSSTLF